MKYENISSLKKQEVYEFFKNNRNNSAPTISKVFNLSIHFVNRIIDEKLNEERSNYKEKTLLK